MIINNIIQVNGVKQWEQNIVESEIVDFLFKIEYPGVKRIYFQKGDENTPEYLQYLNETTPSIEQAKETVCSKIDAKTQELIFVGIIYKAKLLSMSLAAQTNYLGLVSIPDNKFPLPFVTKDDKDYVLVSNAAEAHDLYFIAWNKIADNKIAGGQLKIQVNALQTVEEVLNFIDPR